VPQRRTFSPGQRALLWAAGVLGALAIVIAVLIVLNAQDRKDKELPPPTVTNTSTTIVPPPPPATPGAMPGPEWLDPGPIGNGGDNSAASLAQASSPFAALAQASSPFAALAQAPE
jgi:serine/threonine-protein kinase